MRDLTDAGTRGCAHDQAVGGSYPVVWREGEGPPRTGKLELRPKELRLEGASGPAGAALRTLAYADLRSVRVGRGASERIGGRPSLILERRGGPPVSIVAVIQQGVVSELVERLGSLLAGERGALTPLLVIVPLEPGARGQVQALLEQGPPFDPAQVGLERHHVFVTETEVAFLFQAGSRQAIERLRTDPSILAAAAWQESVAGPPRIAEEAYAWVRAGAAGVS